MSGVDVCWNLNGYFVNGMSLLDLRVFVYNIFKRQLAIHTLLNYT